MLCGFLGFPQVWFEISSIFLRGIFEKHLLLRAIVEVFSKKTRMKLGECTFLFLGTRLFFKGIRFIFRGSPYTNVTKFYLLWQHLIMVFWVVFPVRWVLW